MSQELEKIVIERFNKMDERFNRMDERFDRIDQRMDNMEQKMDNMNEKLNQKIDNVNAELSQKIDNTKKELTDRIDGLSENVAMLEYKVTTELPAIYEAHTLNYQIQKENERKFDSVVETTNKHSIQITHLYETVGNHENQLKKLTS